MAIETWTIFLPLFGAIATYLVGARWGDRVAALMSCAALLASAGLSIWLLTDVVMQGHERIQILAPWITVGAFKTQWAIKLDFLSTVMMTVVTIVSSMVHIYSIGYMKDDKSFPRFMAYMGFFTFFMLMLVVSADLGQMFFGWEGVGLCSYLLIGFWNEREVANDAAIKAFIVNRAADLGLLLAIFGSFALFGSISFEVLFSNAALSSPMVDVIGLLFLIGAMGKSAQIGFHVWLPDAMEGPTPVSALIHAATMVTAGVFMVVRLSPLWEHAPMTLDAMTMVGALTAIMAAALACVQVDIKRVIAYSTMSQLGYMFFAVGVCAYNAAIFHLVTHAFFKALLFLGAGVVIHALSGEQDMRKMGGLYRKMPVTYAMMAIGSLALTGIGFWGVGFSGYFSKEAILHATSQSQSMAASFAYGIGLLVAFMTAFYTMRMMVMTFHGAARDNQVHEGGASMLVPMSVLALGALGVGAWTKGYFIEEPFIGGVEGAVVLALLGFGVCWFRYMSPCGRALRNGALRKALENKFYVDWLYERAICRPLFSLGAFFSKAVDPRLDRYGSDGSAFLAQKSGAGLDRAQTGELFLYAFVFAAGLGCLVLSVWVKG